MKLNNKTIKEIESYDSTRKTVKLEPNKKNGKNKHRFFTDNEEDDDFIIPIKKESILDYYDD